MRYSYQMVLEFKDDSTLLIKKIFTSLESLFKSWEYYQTFYPEAIDFYVYINQIK